MADGWLVRVEIEAGRGEITPLVFAVALEDFQRAIKAAREAPDTDEECKKPRTGDGSWPIFNAEIVAPLDARTVAKLGLDHGEVWSVFKPPLTDRIGFAQNGPASVLPRVAPANVAERSETRKSRRSKASWVATARFILGLALLIFFVWAGLVIAANFGLDIAMPRVS